MSRVSRLKSDDDGQAYYVMNRTVNQVLLFDDEVIKEWIYQEILALAKIYTVDLHAIAVLSNHYHIVLSVNKPSFSESEVEARFDVYQRRLRHPRKWREWLFDEWAQRLSDLSRFMQDLNSSIARYVKRRTNDRGPVWGDRFSSILLDDGCGLLQCMLYVETSPVIAGLCERPSEFKWSSSGRFHRFGREAAGVNIAEIKGFESVEPQSERQEAFRKFVDHLADYDRDPKTRLPPDSSDLLKVLRALDLDVMTDMVLRRTEWLTSLVLGSEAFCRGVMARDDLQSSGQNQPYRFVQGPYISQLRASSRGRD